MFDIITCNKAIQPEGSDKYLIVAIETNFKIPLSSLSDGFIRRTEFDIILSIMGF